MRMKRLSFMCVMKIVRCAVAVLCAMVLVPGDMALYASPPQDAQTAQQDNPKIPTDQLDSLVAPIALYPDPLLSQVLVASTYPLEVIQLQQWLEKNKSLKGDALAQAAKKQDWDPSIQAMAVLPDVVKQLAENIKWTTDLGNAFLAQQGDVMDAVQRMRKKAKDAGNLKSTEQQKVETKVVESKQVIVVQPSSPEVIYVPSYNPTVVYGPPVYPYPPIAYPSPGYYAAGMAVSFGVGMMVGAAVSGGWGWGCGWGHNDVTVNRNNTFVNNSNRNLQGGNRVNSQGGNTWQHNPQHRGGAPYSNRATANRYAGTARGDSMASRQASARQASARSGGALSGASPGTMSANRGGGGDRVGNRQVSSGAGSRSSNAFGGGGGMSGSSARASSQRGASSMASRGGGGRGGGRRR